jgi:hypothetical protein
VGKGVQDAEGPDNDQTVADTKPPVREVLSEGTRSLGHADQEEHDPLHQVRDGMFDEGFDRARSCLCDRS